MNDAQAVAMAVKLYVVAVLFASGQAIKTQVRQDLNTLHAFESKQKVQGWSDKGPTAIAMMIQRMQVVIVHQ